MILASQMRNTYSQIVRYETAINTFRTKYNQLPGDMNNATAFFPTSPSCASTITIVLNATCNGDGNGQIVFAYTSPVEVYSFWQHLAMAGLIEGNFAYIRLPSTGGIQDGFNAVGTPWNNSLISIFLGTGNMMPINGREYFIIGGITRDTGATWAWDNNIPSSEAFSFDTKFDDGQKLSGRIQGRNLNYPPFTSNPCNYSSTQNSACYLTYDLKF